MKFCGISKYPEFSTFSARCHHQFGCIKETVGKGGGGGEIENSIVDIFFNQICRMYFCGRVWGFTGVEGFEVKAGVK